MHYNTSVRDWKAFLEVKCSLLARGGLIVNSDLILLQCIMHVYKCVHMYACGICKDTQLEDIIAVPEDSCGIAVCFNAASSVVPLTLGLRPKPFDEARNVTAGLWRISCATETTLLVAMLLMIRVPESLLNLLAFSHTTFYVQLPNSVPFFTALCCITLIVWSEWKRSRIHVFWSFHYLMATEPRVGPKEM